MKKLCNFLLVGLIAALAGCSDIFETDISKKSVTLIAPADSLKSSNYTNVFWWNSVDGSLNYNLQICSPTFSNLTSIILDTNVSTTKFSYTLNPGNYQWRVRAQNGSSNTPYTTWTLMIDTTALANQILLTNSPSNRSYFNYNKINFSWQPLYGATGYYVNIDSVNRNTSGTSFVYSQATTGASMSYTFPNDGQYVWKVKATKGTDSSQYSVVQYFTIDRVAPSQVLLKSPASTNSSIASPVLTWGNSISSDLSKYKIYLYSDTVSLTPLSSSYPQYITPAGGSTQSFAFNDNISGKRIYWTVTAIDSAGNESKTAVAGQISKPGSKYGYFTKQ